MPEGVLVGRGYVDIRPEFSGDWGRRVRDQADQSGKDGGGIFGKAFGGAMSVGLSALKTSLLGAGLAGASAAIQNVAAASAVAAPALLMAASAGGALKVGMTGVGQTLKDAFDPKKAKQFNAEMAKLAPSARGFVREIQALKPSWESLTKSVQQQLFSNLDSTLARTAHTTLPVLRQSLTQSAGSLNLMARGVLTTASMMAQNGTFGRAMAGANRGLLNLTPLPSILVRELLQLGAAAGPAFGKLTQMATNALGMIASKLDTAFSSGGMATAINAAVGALIQLGRLVGNALLVVGHLMQAMNAGGTQVVGVLGQLLAQLARITGLPAIQQALTVVFQAFAQVAAAAALVIGQLVQAVIPLLGAVAPALGQIAAALGPVLARLAGALGSALMPIITALTPAITEIGLALVRVVSLIAPLLAPISTLITAVLGALVPALTPILVVVTAVAQVLATVLGQAVRALTPLFTVLARVVGSVVSALAQALLPVIGLIAGVLGRLLGALGPAIAPIVALIGTLAVTLTGVLGSAFRTIATAVMPIITMVFTTLGQTLRALMPGLSALVGALATAFGRVAGALIPLLPLFYGLERQLLAALLPVLPVLAGALSRVVISLAALLPPIAGVVARLVSGLAPILTMLAPVLARLAATLATALGQALGLVARLVGVLLAALSPIFPVLTLVVGMVVKLAASLLASLLPPIAQLIGAVVRLIVALLPILTPLVLLAGLILRLAAAILGVLLPPLVSLIGYLLKPLAAALGAIIGWIAQLVTWVASHLAPAWRGIEVAFRAVGAAAVWLWNTVLHPVFNAIATVAKYVAITIITLTVAPIVIALKAFGAIGRWLWQVAIGPAFRGIASVALWLWHNAIQPAFNGIAAVARWVYNSVIRPYMQLVMAELRLVGSIFTWLWRNIVIPVWNGIKTAISASWSFIRTVLTAIWTFLRSTLGPVFTWLWHTIIQPVWNGIKTVINAVWTNGIRPIFNTLKTAVQAVGAAFNAAKDAIATAWNKLKAITKAPVQFIVDVVYNNGIRSVWNTVTKAFGGKQLPKVTFAAGGVMPGYTPGRDVHQFTSPTGGMLALSGGEAVMRPEWTAAVGPQYVAAMNALASRGGIGAVRQAMTGAYASGGIIGNILGGLGSAASTVWDGVKKGAGWLADTFGAAVKAGVSHVVDPLINAIPGGSIPFIAVLKSGLKNMVDSMVAMGSKADATGSSAHFAGGRIPTGQHLAVIDAALKAAHVPPPGSLAQWQSGLNTLITRESGWNANAINLSDCVPLDTLILTRRGWLKHDEVQVGDETIGLDAATGTSRWTPITRVVHYAQAPMVRLGNSRWHAVVTPNHRWASAPRAHVLKDVLADCPECGWEPRGWGGVAVHRSKIHGVRPDRQQNTIGPVRMVTTKDLTSRDRLILAAPAETGSALPISSAEAEVLGWLAGDGHIEQGRRGASMSIAQSKSAGVRRLRELLAGFDVAGYTDERPTRMGKKAIGPRHVFRFRPAYRRDLIRRVGHPKTDAVSIVMSMSREQREAWLNGFIDAEGHRDGGYVNVSQTYGPVLDAAHLAIYLCGYRPRLVDNKVTEPNWSPSAHISACRPVVSGAFLTQEDAGEQDVWCVTTELGTWTCEQDGQIFLTGNSNAAAGDPSRGLAQTIMSTFRAYHVAGTSSSIYDPVANVAAAIRYIVSRYGNISRVQQANASLPPKGYDSGGWWRPGDLGFNGLSVPEAVLTPRQWSIAEQSLTGGSGLQPGDSLRLVVDGQEFTGYVDGRADTRIVRNAKQTARRLTAGRRVP